MELSENGEIAKMYLEGSGYEVVSYKKDSWQEFSKSDLLSLPNQQIWSVQHIEPDEYLNKRIDSVTFTVKNHPLDNIFDMGNTSVTVFLFDGKVIGGFS